jgi:hypothetical protein
MSCSRGEAAPSGATKLRLFADSGGYCQNPHCLEPLFFETEKNDIHIAEMAHVIAAADSGPRGDPKTPLEDRGSYENLILLCANCHTKIDKAPDAFPDFVIFEWKKSHRERIAAAFGAREYDDRNTARSAIEPLLEQNKAIFDRYGPNESNSLDPESETARTWYLKVISSLLPNNRRILMILDANRKFLSKEEKEVLEEFRQHVDDFEARHLGATGVGGGIRFPPQISNILSG